ncbi:MAG TPA: hypothetical protein VJ728_07915 [Candidatus Binataceae bacterium]|nr:hypothetical protein [Candidatus Binataceae bacterium]
MPRTSTGGTSAFTQVQAQARELLARLRTDIRAKDAELKRLRQEESKLAALTGQPGMATSNGGMATGRRGARTRINWGEVLSKLPKQFKASDIRAVRGLRDKRSSEIFAAITRWIEGGAVKRRDRGMYERLK